MGFDKKIQTHALTDLESYASRFHAKKEHDGRAGFDTLEEHGDQCYTVARLKCRECGLILWDTTIPLGKAKPWLDINFYED